MTKWQAFPIVWLCINVLWQVGGQCWKPARRYGIALATSLYAYFYNKDRRKKWVCLMLLGMVGVLSMGYGVDSWLKKACGGSETWTRMIMAALIASVFSGYSILSHHITWQIPLTYGVNLLAWQIRAGRLCQIGKYDILIEDICRATAFAVSLIIF